MKFPAQATLRELADMLHARFEGDPGLLVAGLNEIHVAGEGDLVFVDNEKYYDAALNSPASVVIIDKEVECPGGKGLIISSSPFDDFNALIAHYAGFEPADLMIHPSAKVGEGTLIQPNVFIGDNVRIGRSCIIHPGTVIYGNSTIGDCVTIHANTVIGADAFYYKKKEQSYHRLLSCGGVVIESEVEIGAGSTIDRGVTGNTRIGKGTKIDDQVMIGHDSQIGRNCLFAAQVGIAGAVVIEDDVVLWGQVGVASGLRIGQGAVVLAQTGIPKDLAGGVTYFGTPAGEAKARMRELLALRKLPEIIRQL